MEDEAAISSDSVERESLSSPSEKFSSILVEDEPALTERQAQSQKRGLYLVAKFASCKASML